MNIREHIKKIVGTSLEEAERHLITETLAATEGNKTKAAAILGVATRTIRSKLHNYSRESQCQ